MKHKSLLLLVFLLACWAIYFLMAPQEAVSTTNSGTTGNHSPPLPLLEPENATEGIVRREDHDRESPEVTNLKIRIVSESRLPIENAKMSAMTLEDGKVEAASGISNSEGFVFLETSGSFFGSIFVSAKAYRSVQLSFPPVSGEVVLTPFSNPFSLTVIDNNTEFPIPNCEVSIFARRELNLLSYDSDWVPTGMNGITDIDGIVEFSGDPAFDRCDILFKAEAAGYCPTSFTYSLRVEAEPPILRMALDQGLGVALVDASGHPLSNRKVWYPAGLGATHSSTDSLGWVSPETFSSLFTEPDGRIWLSWITVEYEPGRFYSWNREIELASPREAAQLQMDRLPKFITCTVEDSLNRDYSATVISVSSPTEIKHVFSGWRGIKPLWTTFDPTSNEAVVPISLGGDRLFAILRGPFQQTLEIKEIQEGQETCKFERSSTGLLTLLGSLEGQTPLFIKPRDRENPGIIGPIFSIPTGGLTLQLSSGRYDIVFPNGLSILARVGIMVSEVKPLTVSIPSFSWRHGTLKGSMGGALEGAYLSAEWGVWSCSSFIGNAGDFILPLLSSSSGNHVYLAVDGPGSNRADTSELYLAEFVWDSSAPVLDYTINECRLKIFPSDSYAANISTSFAFIKGNRRNEAEIPITQTTLEALKGKGIFIPTTVKGFRIRSTDGGVLEHYFSPPLSEGEFRDLGYGAKDFQQ